MVVEEIHRVFSLVWVRAVLKPSPRSAATQDRRTKRDATFKPRSGRSHKHDLPFRLFRHEPNGAQIANTQTAMMVPSVASPLMVQPTA
jgi:hypothetical protein